jgi:RNA polymerase sigma factor (sigma-70 family)
MQQAASAISDDALLAARAAEGDTDAFAEIVEMYDAHLRRVCYLVSGDVDVADDAVQAAWEKALRQLRTLKRPEALRAWLSTIAVNEVRQAMRRIRVRRLFRLERLVPAATETPPEAVLDLRRALARIPVRDRQLLALRYVAGLPIADISDALGEKASTTRSRLSRIQSRLREELVL